MKTVPPFPKGDTNRNPADIGFFALIKEDWQTHDRVFLEPALWAVVVHRFGNWRMSLRPRWLRLPFSMLYNVLFTVIHWFFGINLCYTVKMGRRVRLWHHGGMTLGARSIGDDVHFRQNTTLGIVKKEIMDGRPIIGNRVDVGTGACILGHVFVGDDAIIGANAVVTKDVPAGAVVGGVPAKLIKMRNLNKS